jgi:hypothetical protein
MRHTTGQTQRLPGAQSDAAASTRVSSIAAVQSRSNRGPDHRKRQHKDGPASLNCSPLPPELLLIRFFAIEKWAKHADISNIWKRECDSTSLARRVKGFSAKRGPPNLSGRHPLLWPPPPAPPTSTAGQKGTLANRAELSGGYRIAPSPSRPHILPAPQDAFGGTVTLFLPTLVSALVVQVPKPSPSESSALGMQSTILPPALQGREPRTTQPRPETNCFGE